MLHRPFGNSKIYFRIRDLARYMRKHATPAEDFFWEKVRGRKFHDLKINRQFILTALIEGTCKFYIADFYCHELKLIIELDGWVHFKKQDKIFFGLSDLKSKDTLLLDSRMMKCFFIGIKYPRYLFRKLNSIREIGKAKVQRKFPLSHERGG